MPIAAARGSASRLKSDVTASDDTSRLSALEKAGEAPPPATQPDALRPERVPRNAASGGELSEEERRRMIARAAYLIAQRRGFEHGLELEDWLVAEAEVNARLANSTSAPSSVANT
jgi:hypothetical protein